MKKRKTRKQSRAEIVELRERSRNLVRWCQQPYTVEIKRSMIEHLQAGMVVCVPRMEPQEWFLKIPGDGSLPVASVTKLTYTGAAA